MTCNWAYEINQSLECFLRDPQPGLGLWANVIGIIASVAFVYLIGTIIEWIQK